MNGLEKIVVTTDENVEESSNNSSSAHLREDFTLLNSDTPLGMREHVRKLREDNTVDVILDNLKLILIRMESHNLSFLHFRWVRRCFEFPQALISAFMSSSLSVEMFSQDSMNLATNITFGLAILNLILNVTLIFFGYHNKEKQHDLSNKLYTTLFRSVQLKLLQNLTPQEKSSLLQDMLSQLSILEQYEEVVPLRFQTRAENDPTLEKKLRIGDLFL